MADAVIRCEGLGKRYRLGMRQSYRTLRDILAAPWRGWFAPREYVWALRDISFDIRRGELVGIIGANGSGKTTLLKLLSRIARPTEGRAEIRGRVRALLQVGTGFHPELTGRENVLYNGALLGMTRAEILSKFDEIVAFSEVEKFIDTPVKYFSSGMYVRLAFAVAAHLEPEILLVDEVLSVGDAAFQKKSLGKMEQVASEGRTVLYVSHHMASTLRLCTRAILLEHGRVILDDAPTRVIAAYLRPGDTPVAQRVWDNPPGDDRIRLCAVRVHDEQGLTCDQVDIRRPVGIEIDFRVLQPDVRPIPKIAFLNPQGDYLFVSGDQQESARAAGLYRSVCWVPGNFLAEGTVVVTPSITSLDPRLAVHARVPEAVSFQVVDRSEGDGVRGRFPPDWPGAVRPMLQWSTVPVC